MTFCLHLTPYALTRAVPVQLLTGMIMWAEESEIAVATGYRIARDSKGRIRRAFALTARTSIYTSSAGQAYEHPLPSGHRVWSLTGTPGARR